MNISTARCGELCTNYGHIDLMWFDFSYDDMKGEKWEASRLVHMIRELQPHMIIDSRLEAAGGAYGSLITGNTTDYTGDFVCPEQIVPPQGIRDIHGDPVIWESCMTMNNNWGYCSKDHNFKPDTRSRVKSWWNASAKAATCF